MTSKPTRCATSAARRCRHKRHGVASLHNKQTIASSAPHAWRCPQGLWTKLRTAAMESGFTPYAARARQLWRNFDHPWNEAESHRGASITRRAAGVRARLAAPEPRRESRRTRSDCTHAGHRLRETAATMSTIAVDKAADTRDGIGFHALCRKGVRIMAKF